MPAEEVRALGRLLRGRADAAEEVRVRLADDGDVDGTLRSPVSRFLADRAMVAAALAEELRRLGATVTAVADSWVQLDAALLPSEASGPPR